MIDEVVSGDCAEVLRCVPEESVQMAYLDPPFFTQKTHRLRKRGTLKESSFDDLWMSREEYVQFLTYRLQEVKRVLTPTGSIFVHCNRQSTHIVKCLLDEIFGAANARAEIIWTYKRWSNSQRALRPAHQTLHYYSKSSNYTFNPLLEDYSFATNVDQNLQKRERDGSGRAVYKLDERGAPVPSNDKKGVPIGDVWDIPYLNPKAKERVGYPTQKPILLMERVISLATDPGDLVLDPFCGSGTTLVAAKLLGRNYIGIDISDDAVAIANERLHSPQVTRSRLLDAGRDTYQQHDKFAAKHLSTIDHFPVQRNSGIDAILNRNFGAKPVLIRVQRPGEMITSAALALARAGAKKQAGALVLLVTRKDEVEQLSLSDSLPESVILIQSPELQLSEALDQMQIDV